MIKLTSPCPSLHPTVSLSPKWQMFRSTDCESERGSRQRSQIVGGCLSGGLSLWRFSRWVKLWHHQLLYGLLFSGSSHPASFTEALLAEESSYWLSSAVGQIAPHKGPVVVALVVLQPRDCCFFALFLWHCPVLPSHVPFIAWCVIAVPYTATVWQGFNVDIQN